MDIPKEELEFEKTHSELPKEEEVRNKIIEDYGFDPETDGEKIDKLVGDKMDSHKKLSQAIGQKIKYREDFTKYKKENPGKSSKTDDGSGEGEGETRKDELSQDDILTLARSQTPKEDFPEVKKFAKHNELTIEQALADPVLIQILADKKEKRDSAEAAADKNKRSGSKTMADDELLRKHREEGYTPDPGTPEAEQLFWAKRGGRRE